MAHIRHDGSYIRSQRLLKVAKLIAQDFAKQNKSNLETLRLNIIMDFGLTEKKTNEYIDLVCRARDWEINNGFITPRKV